MSLRVTLTCDGHRCQKPCASARVAGLAYSPILRSDDPTRPLVTSLFTDHWRIGALPTGGDLCPHTGHDEDQ